MYRKKCIFCVVTKEKKNKKERRKTVTENKFLIELNCKLSQHR